MALDAVKNFSKVTVSGTYNANQYQITVSDGSRFPDPSTAGQYNIVWYNDTDYPDPADDPNAEIDRVIAVSGNVLTLANSGGNRTPQEGTSATTKNLPNRVYKIILGLTAKMITDIQSAINAKAQAGDNVSVFVNDAGYITASGADARIDAQKAQPSGLATLGSDGLIPTSQLPPLAITDTFVVASEVDMLALTAQVGDVAIRTDINETFILAASPASTLANWKQILTPAAPVQSISNTDETIDVSSPSGNVIVSLKRTPITVTYSSTITPTISGALSIQRIIATGDLTINIPTGGTDGANLELWITASGADRQLTLNAGIKIPTSSVFTSPQVISSGKKAKLLLQYDATLNGGQWELTSFINGY